MNRKLFFVVLAALIVCNVNTYADNVVVGSQATVPNWQWVNIHQSIVQRFVGFVTRADNRDICGIEAGNMVTVVKVLGDSLLVEYSSPDGHPLGTSCGDGTRFVLAKSDLATMTERYNATQEAERREKELVREILAKNYYGEPIDVGEWHWVRVVNPEPVIRHFSNGDFPLGYGEECGCGGANFGRSPVEGGTIRVRGEANGKVLYEYTARGNPMGTPCPSGVLFFGERC